MSKLFYELWSRRTYNRPQSEGVYLVEANGVVKESHFGGFAGRLFESLTGIRMAPILVVTLQWKLDVKAV